MDVIDIREGTRTHYTAGVGLIVFLIGWGVTFGALFLAYAFIRVRAPEWPPDGAPLLPLMWPLVCTVMAVGCSVAYHRALLAVRRSAKRAVSRWLWVACAFGVGFLVFQWAAWAELWGEEGLRLGQNAYAGTYYMLTMFHASHVVFAIGSVVALVPKLRRGEFTARNHLPVKLTGWFWHFVTGAWVGTFLTLYAF